MRRWFAAAVAGVAVLVGAAGAVTPAEAAAGGLSVEVTVSDSNYNTLHAGDQIQAGEALQITVAVSNAAGSSTVSNVRAGLWLPAGVDYSAADNDPAGVFDQASRTVTWLGGPLLGTIAGGDSPHSLVVWLTANKAMTFSDLTVFAAVAADAGQLGNPAESCVKPQCAALNASSASPSPSDDPSTPAPSSTPSTSPSDEPTPTPTTSPSEPAASSALTVTVKGSTSSASPGSSASYVVTVSNAGDSDAKDVRLSMKLSSGLTVGAARPAGAVNSETGTYDVQLGNVPAGNAAIVDLAVSVSSAAEPGDQLILLASAGDGAWSRPEVCSETDTSCAAGQLTVASPSPSTSPTQPAGTEVDSGRPGAATPFTAGTGVLILVGAVGLLFAATPRARRAR